MIDIEVAVRKLLVAAPAVTALVSTRLYPDALPQGVELPAVVYQEISRLPSTTHDGPSSLEGARIQIDAYATARTQAFVVIAAITAVLCPRRPAEGYSRTVGGVVIQAVFPIGGARSGYEPDTNLYRRMAEYEVWAAPAA